MLPKPHELRERSRFYQAAAREAADVDTKRRLAAHAFALAQLAEAIERDEHSTGSDGFKRVLNDALGTVDDQLLGEMTTEIEKRRQITRWRERAEELRTTADQFAVPSAQDALRRAAANCDRVADHAESLLTGR